MKKLLLLAALLVSAGSLFAQGTVNFGNTTSTLIRTNVGGVSGNVSGNTGAYRFQLLVGAAGSTDLSSFTVIATATNSPTLAGRIFGGTQTNSFTGPGGAMAVAVRGWLVRTPGEATFESSFINGTSGVLQLGSSGNPLATPPGTPAAIFGPGLLQGFELTPVPEPSSIALGLLGLGAVALFRRRK